MIPTFIIKKLPNDVHFHIQKYLSTPSADIIRTYIMMTTPLPWHLLDDYLDDGDSGDDC